MFRRLRQVRQRRTEHMSHFFSTRYIRYRSQGCPYWEHAHIRRTSPTAVETSGFNVLSGCWIVLI